MSEKYKYNWEPLILLLLIIHCSRNIYTPEPVPPSPPRVNPGLEKLLRAYPGKFKQVLPNYIQWEDGTLMPYQIDVGPKDFKTLVECPDLEDQMVMPYTAGKNYTVPIPKHHEPGHIRYSPFFQKMYGATEAEVTRHLVPIIWLPTTVGRTLWITSVNDIHLKLQAVSEELDLLPPEIKRFVTGCAGTFNWRPIAGSRRISPHGYGIAIDINASLANYWQWDYLVEDPYQDIDLEYRNTIPMEIVEIFEKHGFIWGGKWYQYDTMHFEYRPELLPLESTTTCIAGGLHRGATGKSPTEALR